MSRSGAEATVEQRLALALRRLATAFDVDSAMAAMSTLDMAGLRDLELTFSDRYPRRMSEEELRVALAEVHVKRKRGKQMLSTQPVTAGVFQRWALDTLQEWLAGYTDWDDELGGQFRITYLGNDVLGEKYRVETADRRGDHREFRLAVAVLLVDPEAGEVAAGPAAEVAQPPQQRREQP
jgi:hypothetical protein